MDRTLVIIPTYNEVENIEKIIKKIFSEKSFDILVVDDSSPDGTADKVIELSYQFKNKLFLKGGYKKRGIGKAYLIGFKWALQKKYDYIFQMDADLSHNPKELSKMLDYLKNDVDLIVGSRYVEGINVINWPLSRILLSYFASLYVRILTLMPIKDPTSGFVGYKSNVLSSLRSGKIRFSGYAFQIEMKFRIFSNGLSYVEHPITFYERRNGKSKLASSVIFEGLLNLFKLKYLRIINKL